MFLMQSVIIFTRYVTDDGPITSGFNRPVANFSLRTLAHATLSNVIQQIT